MKDYYSLLLQLYKKAQKSWNTLKILITLAIWVAIACFVYSEKERFSQILVNPNLEWRWVALSALLLSINIGMEALKWFLVIRIFDPSIRYGTAYQAILTGSASAFITPQKIGDYIGRLLYLNPENRTSAVIATLLDRFAQLGATLIFASLACFYFGFSFFPYTFFLLLATLIFHVFLWSMPISFSYLALFFRQINFIKDVLTKIPFSLLIITSLLSIIRFAVFLVQYILIFKAFGTLHEDLWALCCLTFFVKSFVPSLAFSELGIREGVALWVFGHLSDIHSVVVFQVTFILFVINTLIPAGLGAWLIKNLKT